MTKNVKHTVDHPSNHLVLLAVVGMIFACWPSALLFCLDFLDSESPMEHMFSTRSNISCDVRLRVINVLDFFQNIFSDFDMVLL